jgi:hypothetical protein
MNMDTIVRTSWSIGLGFFGLMVGAYFYYNTNARVMMDYRRDFLGGFGVLLPFGLGLLGLAAPWLTLLKGRRSPNPPPADER